MALLRDITQRWTVDDLGREVGLSRSALADRLIRLIGAPPMHYLVSLAHAGLGAFAPRFQKGVATWPRSNS